MSPFIVMILASLAAGLLIPVTAMVAAWLGICDPFSLTFAGRTWTFSKPSRRQPAKTS
jgi:hypothetical protein